MEQPRDDTCGCGGPGRPLYELKLLVAALERLEHERRQREERDKKAGA